MSYAQAILLGGLQGVTEFLPISSSGHLLIFKQILSVTDVPLSYDVLLHGATLAVILIFFRRRLWDLVVTGVRQLHGREWGGPVWGLLGNIILTSLVTASLGLTVERVIPLNNLVITGVCYCVTVLLIIITMGIRKRRESGGAVVDFSSVTWKIALLVGIAQGLAVLPGISRAGATIAVACMAGVHGREALEYSFLVAIPAICGALLLQVLRGIDLTFASPQVIILGLAAAFVTGYFSIGLLKVLNSRNRQILFVPYLLVLAAISIVLYR